MTTQTEHVYTNSVPYSATASNDDSTKRRKIKVELNEISQCITQHSLEDNTSKVINLWQHAFSLALRTNEPLQPIIEKYTLKLKEILRCPLDPEAYLNGDALLGSDGFSYNRKSLCIFYSNVEPAYRKRSPANLHDKTRFSADPHPVVQCAARWLTANYNVDLSCPRIDSAYANLVRENRVPFIPTKQDLQHIDANADSSEDCDSEALSDDEWFKEGVKEAFSRVNQDGAEGFQENLRRMRNVAARDQARCHEAEQKVTQLETRVAFLKEENEKLKNEIQYASVEISEVKRNIKELEIATNELEIAIKEREHGWASALLLVVGVIGGCYVATVLLEAVVTGVAVAPVNLGPTKIGVGITSSI